MYETEDGEWKVNTMCEACLFNSDWFCSFKQKPFDVNTCPCKHFKLDTVNFDENGNYH